MDDYVDETDSDDENGNSDKTSKYHEILMAEMGYDVSAWEYVGGRGIYDGDDTTSDKDKRLKKWHKIMKDTPLPPYTRRCVCTHKIRDNCCVRSTRGDGAIRVLGNCCYRRYMPDRDQRKSKCELCGAPHSQRNENVCKRCIAERVAREREANAKKCAQCGEKHRCMGNLCRSCADDHARREREANAKKCAQCGEKHRCAGDLCRLCAEERARQEREARIRKCTRCGGHNRNRLAEKHLCNECWDVVKKEEYNRKMREAAELVERQRIISAKREEQWRLERENKEKEKIAQKQLKRRQRATPRQLELMDKIAELQHIMQACDKPNDDQMGTTIAEKNVYAVRKAAYNTRMQLLRKRESELQRELDESLLADKLERRRVAHEAEIERRRIAAEAQATKRRAEEAAEKLAIYKGMTPGERAEHDARERERLQSAEMARMYGPPEPQIWRRDEPERTVYAHTVKAAPTDPGLVARMIKDQERRAEEARRAEERRKIRAAENARKYEEERLAKTRR